MSGRIQVHRVVEGDPDAPVLVLANSLGSTLSVWGAQMPELSRHFRVVRFDLRGHGTSPVPPEPYELEDLGGDLLGLLDDLDVERAHLCGLSLGGLIDMWVAANAPDRVDRMVLCCTSADFGNEAAWAERAATVRAHGVGAVADAVVARWFTPAFSAAHPDVVARMRAMIADTPAEGYAACCGVVERADLRESLPAIRASTLVIAGREDPAAPPGHAEVIAEGIPDARLSVVEDAAHLAIVEQPEEVTRLVLNHLLGGPVDGQ